MASEASNAGLERALVLARNARGAACREAIEHALAAPDVHVFAELMDLPQVSRTRCSPCRCDARAGRAGHCRVERAQSGGCKAGVC